nr:DUF2530 domain-containing protein [Cellulosimicrobium arenosum]
MRVDLRRVILGGIAAWVSGLVVAAVLLATGMTTSRGVATCAVGIVLGGVGLLWERTHRDDYLAPVPGEPGEPSETGRG